MRLSSHTEDTTSSMRAIVIIVLALTLVLSTIVTAQAACWHDVLQNRSGNLLATRSGAVFRVLERPAAIAFWLPLSRIIVCDQVFINVAGEPAIFYEIRNQDGNEMVRAVRED